WGAVVSGPGAAKGRSAWVREQPPPAPGRAPTGVVAAAGGAGAAAGARRRDGRRTAVLADAVARRAELHLPGRGRAVVVHDGQDGGARVPQRGARRVAERQVGGFVALDRRVVRDGDGEGLARLVGGKGERA